MVGVQRINRMQIIPSWVYSELMALFPGMNFTIHRVGISDVLMYDIYNAEYQQISII